MEVLNPRFPHWCRITRKTVENPLEDEGGFTPIENEYDPLGGDGDEEPIDEEQQQTVSDDTETDDSDDGVQVQVIYEGACRSYEKNTTSDRGDIITSFRGLSLPLNQHDWTKLGYAPQEGDEVAVDRGAYKEYGRVVDKNPATASFAGTHIVWRYGRN